MSQRLLLVEDEDSIREIAAISLERVGGWEVVSAPSGRAAIAAAERGQGFDTVLLDVMMPGLDGPATMRSLRAGPLGGEVPFVFLTAKLQAADRRRLAELGAAGVIAKPFDPMILAEELDRILVGTCRIEGKRTEVDPDFAQLWARQRGRVEARVELIAAAVDALTDGRDAPERLVAAVSAAHQLSGSLGTFGVERGSELARSLELGLEGNVPPHELRALSAELAELVQRRQPEPIL